jgi:hypothetical protein
MLIPCSAEGWNSPILLVTAHRPVFLLPKRYGLRAVPRTSGFSAPRSRARRQHSSLPGGLPPSGVLPVILLCGSVQAAAPLRIGDGKQRSPGGGFLRAAPECRHSNRQSRGEWWVNRPGAGERATVATLAADEKASLSWRGFFCRGPPALGETYSVARRSCCGLVGILGARFRTPREQRLAGRPTIS